MNDAASKFERQQLINASKYRAPAKFKTGDGVLLKNYTKTSKFQPSYIPERFTILRTEDQGRTVVLERDSDGTTLRRHPDHLKRFDFENPAQPAAPTPTEQDVLRQFHKQFNDINDINEYPDDSNEPLDVNHHHHHQQQRRERRNNPRYFNENFVNQ